MKKILLLVIVNTLCVTLTIAQNGRENWFPNKGNVGIGTRTPEFTLHIIGNLKVTEEIIGKSLQIDNDIQSNDLKIRRNAIILGKLGIGVQNPIENFELTGNAKISGNLTAAAVTFQTLNANSGVFNSLTVNQTSILNGLVGIGTATPLEKLHVAGNIKVDNSLFSNTIQTNQFNSGFGTFSEKLTVSKDALISGKVGIGVAAPSESLDIAGNAKLSGSLTASQGNFSQSLTAGNTSIAGTLQVSGAVTAQSLNATDIHATGPLTADQNLNVTGTTTVNALQVNEALAAQNITALGISTSDNVKVGQNLTVTGITKLNNDVTVTGNSTMTGNLTVSGVLNAASLSFSNVNATGNATIAQNLDVTGTTHLGGDVTVNGNLKTGIIEATEFRTLGGGSPFNFENAIISKTLAIATDKAVPSNYKMAVGGNIIATGIDIKIPQKWPDYVFTDGHNLLSISEVENYIKKNGHLPNVLSAEEMKARENYSVSEMDAKLLEKIEELTLYVIELRKEIDSLKKK